MKEGQQHALHIEALEGVSGVRHQVSVPSPLRAPNVDTFSTVCGLSAAAAISEIASSSSALRIIMVLPRETEVANL